MKKGFLILLLLPVFAFQCNKNAVNKCYKGKIIRITCASYVIQVLNNDTIGDDQWKDSMEENGKTYDNVFNVANKCKIASSYKPGDIIYFNLETPVATDCVVCLMYDAPPQAQFQIKNITSGKCE